MSCIGKDYFKDFEIITFIEHTDSNKPYEGLSPYKQRKLFSQLKEHLNYCIQNIHNTEFIWHVGNINFYIVIREKHPHIICNNELDEFNTFLNNYISNIKAWGKEEEDY